MKYSFVFLCEIFIVTVFHLHMTLMWTYLLLWTDRGILEPLFLWLYQALLLRIPSQITESEKAKG